MASRKPAGHVRDVGQAAQPRQEPVSVRFLIGSAGQVTRADEVAVPGRTALLSELVRVAENNLPGLLAGDRGLALSDRGIGEVVLAATAPARGWGDELGEHLHRLIDGVVGAFVGRHTVVAAAARYRGVRLTQLDCLAVRSRGDEAELVARLEAAAALAGGIDAVVIDNEEHLREGLIAGERLVMAEGSNETEVGGEKTREVSHVDRVVRGRGRPPVARPLIAIDSVRQAEADLARLQQPLVERFQALLDSLAGGKGATPDDSKTISSVANEMAARYGIEMVFDDQPVNLRWGDGVFAVRSADGHSRKHAGSAAGFPALKARGAARPALPSLPQSDPAENRSRESTENVRGI